ncbi:phosphodiesterase [Kosmotoga arenicorallina S304]|uniref:Phosphodiesterase n=1 Tax=Kosmotoga arenicorallina S304 TaxID=1453497 RepID=A0A176K308_9BACT|nr:alkaline phosphatase family protein [Kosmotoga arenicorallina]OAA31428.1 phosphodiesterase [Kosmotoga arenicorallina S304]
MLDENNMLPDYNERAISNFSSGLVAHFCGSSVCEPFPFTKHNIDLSGIDSVVVFIIDALRYATVEKLLDRGNFEIINKSSLIYMTSVFPSTTTAALTSYFTGVPPATHGMLGYTLYLKEYGSIVNMIEFTPLYQERDSLSRIGFDPLKFLPVQTIFQQLHENGVKGYLITSKSFVNTGLSRMHSNGGHLKGVYGIGDTFEELHSILKSGSHESLTFIYWGLIDTYGHRYGPDSKAYELESYWLLKIIEEFFVRIRKKGVAFFIVSDHGQIITPWKEEVWWSRYDSDIYNLLYALPTGEHRAVYLHTHYPGKLKDVIEKKYPGKFKVLLREKALELNLFGGTPQQDFLNRIGEVIVIPEKDSAFCFKYTGQEHSMKGRHGGLSYDEMKIPIIYMKK